jgi:DNA-binding transcriptional LysR family regulator
LWGSTGTVTACAIKQPVEIGSDPVQAAPGLATKVRAERGPATRTGWQSVEVRHLAALAAVAREGSFRRAADGLGYVQSAISGQIAHLERAAGTRLLERSSGASTVTPTSAGHVLLEHADEIFASLSAAQADLDSLAKQTAHTLRVAGQDQISPGRLARILRLFRQRHPSMSVKLDSTGDEELGLERLERGTIDLLICEMPLTGGPYGHVVLEDDPYVLLAGVDSPRDWGQEPPNAAQIASVTLMLPGAGRAHRRLEDRLCDMGVEPLSPLQPDSVATAQSLVGAGLGEAIVPAQLIDRTDPHTVAIELGGLLPHRRVALVFSIDHERTPAFDGFIRAARVGCGYDSPGCRQRNGAHALAAWTGGAQGDAGD